MLSPATLNSLPATVAIPQYQRDQLSPGIIHFGPGNFHRAHQGIYLDRLMNQGLDLDWAVVGASIMPNDQALRETIISQGMLSTVIQQSAHDSQVRVVGHLFDYLPVADHDAIVKALIAPGIRIVTMTITEGGYFVDASTGRFDHTHPAIVADSTGLTTPKTVFGILVKALRLRRDAGLPPFTVLSCDNLPHNGEVARQAVVGFADRLDTQLATWIDRSVTFPNAMVDRIASATGAEERRLVAEQYGVSDQAPVFCEDFSQWVIEDKFVAGRPALETVGAQFVPDVTPFETMKIRILNGGHALIAYPAGLLDIELASEAIEDPLIGQFLDKVEREEILPTVPPVPQTNLNDYLDLIKKRVANPRIRDTVRRLCLDGSNRQPKFIVTTIRERLEVGLSVDGLALESALWCRYCYGKTDSGATIEPNDPSWTHLNQVSIEARKTPLAWLNMQEIYGDLSKHTAFSAAFSRWLAALWNDGTRSTLQSYVRAT